MFQHREACFFLAIRKVARNLHDFTRLVFAIDKCAFQGQIDYTAAKGAIESATKTTAREFASYRARVNAIAPGPVNTPMLAEVGEAGIQAMARGTLVGRVAEPQDMANVICALADPKIAGYVTGEIVQVNGGMYLD